MERETFGQLAKENHQDLVRFGERQKVGAGEDLVQTVYGRMYSKDYAPADFRKIAFTGVRNVAHDLRRRSQRLAFESFDDVSVPECGDDAGLAVLHAAIADYLATLGPDDREVIRLAWIEGFTERELVEQTGLGRAAVRGRLERGRAAMAVRGFRP